MTERIETEDSGYLRLLKQFGEAWDAADVDKLMSMITDDCGYCASVGPEPGTTYAGKAAVREGFLAMLAFDSGGCLALGGCSLQATLGSASGRACFEDSTPISRFEAAISLNSAVVGFPVKMHSGSRFLDVH